MEDKIKELDDLILNVESLLKSEQKKIDLIYEVIEDYRDQINALRSQKVQILLSKNPRDWNVLLNMEFDHETYKILKSMFDHESPIRFEGYCSETYQRVPKISLHQKNNNRTLKALKILEEVLPFMKPVMTKSEQGSEEKLWKFVSIFEWTLSANGIFQLLISEERKEYVITKTTYGTTYKAANFSDLLSALKFIQENHPYDRKLVHDYDLYYKEEY